MVRIFGHPMARRMGYLVCVTQPGEHQLHEMIGGRWLSADRGGLLAMTLVFHVSSFN